MMSNQSARNWLFSKPLAYERLQTLVRRKTAMKYLVDVIKPFNGARILDVGCGNATILNHLGNVEYLGIDKNPRCIETAQKNFGSRADFNVLDISELTSQHDKCFDRIILIGVLHHLSDDQCTSLLDHCSRILVPSGFLVSVDPTITPKQNWFARKFALADRGRFVRSPEMYKSLLDASFGKTVSEVKTNLLRVPYSNFVAVAN
jgi:2-polyprenyl-3-methyl-5-hydroxy-6-metoxy-1,4-benzoquinol methylase